MFLLERRRWSYHLPDGAIMLWAIESTVARFFKCVPLRAPLVLPSSYAEVLRYGVRVVHVQL